MSSPGIENPKVFISYAWGSKEYQEKVIALARDLMRDGIEVVLDKWSLKEGNDTYAFMEKSVTDSEITNVLILLDPEYEIKANERSGGVGTETQIISPAIYNKVNQEKFLPIIFERGLEGEVPKPAYLKGLLHFDLSKEENYDDEYERLAKRLYGVEIVKKPEIGSRPAWIDSTTTINTKVRNKFSALRNNLPHKAKIEQFELFLSDFKNRFIHFKKDETVEKLEHKDYIALYAETKSLRDEFLHLLSYIPFVDTGEKLVASKLEEVCEDLKGRGGYVNEIQKTLLHEIFIYLIAIYYKSKNYAAISYTLTKTYFVSDYYKGNAQSFNIFYYLNQNFDNAVQHQDGKKYYSGTAQYWMNNINTDVCSKNDLVFADCYYTCMADMRIN